MKRYVTHNLDEAAYLVLHGLKYRGEKLGVVSSSYSFVWDAYMEKCRKEFWGKGAKVNLHSWLAVRSGLKNEMRTRPMLETTHKTKKVARRHLANGSLYYYVQDGQVLREAWGGKNPIHQGRFDAGNVFFTREEATNSITNDTDTEKAG